MRVLTGTVLVVLNPTTDSLVSDSRRGTVHLTGSSQIEKGEEVLFGPRFEEIDLDVRSGYKYYLMDEDNIKIIFGNDPDPVQTNILPFNREKLVG